MSQIPQSVIVHPSANSAAQSRCPGDKSISHRVAMMAALASGTSTGRNFLQSEDCVNTLRAMEALGARSVASRRTRVADHPGHGRQPAGAGRAAERRQLRHQHPPAGRHSGRAGRTYEMTGDESLCSRPMTRIKEPLERMGAKVELTGEKGTAPIKITGGKLKAINYVLPVASAQVKSCLLLAGLFADGVTTVTEPMPTRDHTERMFRTLGICPGQVDGLQVQITGQGTRVRSLKAREFRSRATSRPPPSGWWRRRRARRVR
jgi:3-phosphoshikimate 1-carboxyvinyltransferase